MRMPGISLDFDSPDDPNMKKAVIFLLERYHERVMVRKSSSGRGWHVRVFPRIVPNNGHLIEDHSDEHDPDMELQLREMLNDCHGRCVADGARVRCGLKSSRLFFVKSGKIVGKWVPGDIWLKESSE